MIKELSPKNCEASGLGFMNTINSFGPAMYLMLVSMTLDWAWDGRVVDNSPYYSLNNYYIAMGVLLFAFVLAMILLPFIKETFCKNKY